jgi:flagellar biosynthesis protein FlhF
MDPTTIRTFRGANARDALAQARAALGPEAIVLHAREVPAGFFGRVQFEVMAATEPADAPPSPQPRTQPQPRSQPQTQPQPPTRSQPQSQPQSPSRPQSPPPSRDTWQPALTAPETPLGASGPWSYAQREAAAPPAPSFQAETPYSTRPSLSVRLDPPPGPEREALLQAALREPVDAPFPPRADSEGWRLSLQAREPAWKSSLRAADEAAVRQASRPEPSPRSESPQRPQGEMSSELREMRSALEEARSLLGAMTSRSQPSLQTGADEVHEALSARGMDPAQAARLVKEALSQGAPLKPLALTAAVRDLLHGALVTDRAPWVRKGRMAVALVGPTGVGKTTTVAKIAARAMVEQGRKVGLITVDTYRIGGSEQLARYGEIMGLPTFVVRGRPELTAALERLAQCDLILVDTAGRSQNDQVLRQAELVRTVPGLELHLVASAATGFRDLAAVAERYRSLRPERIILSKLDEAAAPAGFLSLTTELPVPVSCVCDGQRVPEDIHGVTRADLVDLVLGSWNHDRV